jgi:hypothetical protein
MGQYYRQPPPKSSAPHPIWNGLGCLLLIVVPAMSIALAVLIVSLAVDNNWPIPYQLLGHPIFPPYLFITPALAWIFGGIASINNLYAYIAVSAVFMLLLFGIVSFVYSLIYRIAGPSRYGPLDAPPIKIKTKSFKR